MPAASATAFFRPPPRFAREELFVEVAGCAGGAMVVLLAASPASSPRASPRVATVRTSSALEAERFRFVGALDMSPR
jgi:hypothetical protein